LNMLPRPKMTAWVVVGGLVVVVFDSVVVGRVYGQLLLIGKMIISSSAIYKLIKIVNGSQYMKKRKCDILSIIVQISLSDMPFIFDRIQD